MRLPDILELRQILKLIGAEILWANDSFLNARHAHQTTTFKAKRRSFNIPLWWPTVIRRGKQVAAKNFDDADIWHGPAYYTLHEPLGPDQFQLIARCIWHEPLEPYLMAEACMPVYCDRTGGSYSYHRFLPVPVLSQDAIQLFYATWQSKTDREQHTLWAMLLDKVQDEHPNWFHEVAKIHASLEKR